MPAPPAISGSLTGPAPCQGSVYEETNLGEVGAMVPFEILMPLRRRVTTSITNLLDLAS
jgi:hypothetical protein